LDETPCGEIAGLVIYDLPGRDCAAKASNGELPVGSLSRYKSEYIDRKLPQKDVYYSSFILMDYSYRCHHQGTSKCCQ